MNENKENQRGEKEKKRERRKRAINRGFVPNTNVFVIVQQNFVELL
jgi:hypothetical protein